jgi:hypothetical protein
MSLWLAPLALLLAVTPAARDTTARVTIRGVVLILDDPAGGPERAVVLLSDALRLGTDRIWLLAVTGTPKRMERWSGLFVEAAGSITGTPPDSVSFTPSRVKEVEPDGAVRQEVDLSLSQHAVVTLAVVPRRFDVPPNGRGNRISPVVLYKIANHGQSDLDFMFSSNEFVCVGLLRAGDTTPRWRGVWRVSQPSPRLTIRIGSVFRSAVPIPPTELAWPDHYTVRATLCGVAEYAATVPLEVSGN